MWHGQTAPKEKHFIPRCIAQHRTILLATARGARDFFQLTVPNTKSSMVKSRKANTKEHKVAPAQHQSAAA